MTSSIGGREIWRNTFSFSFVTEYMATFHIIIPRIDLQQRVWSNLSFDTKSSIRAQLSLSRSSRFTIMERYRERLRVRGMYGLAKKYGAGLQRLRRLWRFDY